MEKKSEIILIIGRRGCGKTTLAKDFIKDKNRLIILDTMKEYNIGYLADKYIDFAKYVYKNRYNDYMKVSYYPTEKSIKAVFDVICDMLWEMSNITFVIEELARFMNSKSYPESFDRLTRASRHKCINIYGITQRAVDIPVLLRSQSNKICTFQQIEVADVNYLKQLFDATDIKKIRNFDKFEYLEYLDNGEKTVKRFKPKF